VPSAGSVAEFATIDSSGHPEAFVACLELQDDLPAFRSWRQATNEGLRLRPGAKVVDVGCGLGTAAIDLVRRVGPDGVVIGVDPSLTMIECARRGVNGAGFEIGNATSLPLADGSLDAYRAERVFQWLADQPAALAEARRVLRPGGRVAIMDADHDGILLNASDRSLTRRIVHGICDTVNEGWTGRRLAGLLRGAGFVDIEVELSPLATADHETYGQLCGFFAETALASGVITAAERDHWLADLQECASAGDWFFVWPIFVASATRP
jgi:SAM-dependent methyltransferase